MLAQENGKVMKSQRGIYNIHLDAEAYQLSDELGLFLRT